MRLRRRAAIGWACAAIVALLGVLVATVVRLAFGEGQANGASASGLHVSGNRILDHDGRPVLFQGVNRSGTEYACVQGTGIFDGEVDQAAVTAMLSCNVTSES